MANWFRRARAAQAGKAPRRRGTSTCLENRARPAPLLVVGYRHACVAYGGAACDRAGRARREPLEERLPSSTTRVKAGSTCGTLAPCFRSVLGVRPVVVARLCARAQLRIRRTGRRHHRCGRRHRGGARHRGTSAAPWRPPKKAATKSWGSAAVRARRITRPRCAAMASALVSGLLRGCGVR